ncbi:hypothetical protein ACFWXO_16590 [Kitasatospora sp. NPDC059088]|uniref:hypothetical protein n=1 Tax=Kitasatospora sp. NPDC059088 TaxID=3346722 RepID=UPI0036872BBA
MVADRRSWISFERHRDAFAPVSVAQSLAAGIGIVGVTAVSATVAFFVTEWNLEQWHPTQAFGFALKVLGFYPLLPGFCALVLSVVATWVSVAGVFGKGGSHEDDDRCTCRRCRWSYWVALDLRRLLRPARSVVMTAVAALLVGLAADAATAAGLGLFRLADGQAMALRIAAGLLGFVLFMAGFVAHIANVPWSLLSTFGVFESWKDRKWWQKNGNAPELAALTAALDPNNAQEQLFQNFLKSNTLPRNINGEGETPETYRLLGVDAEWTAPADSLGLVPATWPEGWELVRQELGFFWFQLLDEAGTPMVEGLVNSKVYDPRAFLRLTAAGRQEARRVWRGLPESQRALVQQRGGPWKPAHRTVEAGPRFGEGDNYPLVAARLRAKGWNVGKESATGIQITLSDAASAWTAEREAGESFWLLPSGTDAPRTGCADAGSYPWYPQATRASWQNPGAIADEVDQILRQGYREELCPDGEDADVV